MGNKLGGFSGLQAGFLDMGLFERHMQLSQCPTAEACWSQVMISISNENSEFEEKKGKGTMFDHVVKTGQISSDCMSLSHHVMLEAKKIPESRYRMVMSSCQCP